MSIKPLKNYVENLKQKTAHLPKFAWLLNQPGITGFSKRFKYIQLGLYMSYKDDTGNFVVSIS